MISSNHMKKNSTQDYAKALFEVTNGLKGENLKEAVGAFAKLLYEKNILKRAAQIIAEYEAYAKKQAGYVAIHITTARTIEKTTVEHIKKIFGDMVEATQTVDESLLGGMIVRTEGTILDASLKTQLKKLKEVLV